MPPMAGLEAPGKAAGEATDGEAQPATDLQAAEPTGWERVKSCAPEILSFVCM